MIGIVLVAVGAALGATARYALASAWRARFPWSILTANVIGSFLLGILLVRAQDDVYLFLGVGFCGALTTFSTFALDTLLLAREGRTPAAGANVVVSVTGSVAAVAAGLLLARAIGS